jgi:hypothetical protein
MKSFNNTEIDVPLRGTFSKRSLSKLKKFKLSERSPSGFSSRQLFDKSSI